MVIFSYLVGGAVGACLLLFLFHSRFEPVSLPPSQKAFCLLGCGALLCLSFHWALLIPAACMAAFAMARFLGGASCPRSLAFAGLFGSLYSAAYFAVQLLPPICGTLSPVNLQFARLTALFALTCAAVIFSRKWRNFLQPMAQLLPNWLLCALLCALCIWQSATPGAPILHFFALLWQLYSALTTCAVRKQIVQRLDLARQQQDIRRQYAMQEDYYRQLQQKQAQTRALWHDLSKYLRAAKAETAPSEALEKLQEMLDDATAIIDVCNPVVNVILNEYAQTAKGLGIELRLKVQIPETVFVSAADLYVIIGNTMDNAIEACRSLPQPQRLIDLTLRTHGDMLFYRLANPYDPRYTGRQQDPLRGYGLDNVHRCVDAYDGQLLTQKDKGFFIVSAHMNKPIDPIE